MQLLPDLQPRLGLPSQIGDPLVLQLRGISGLASDVGSALQVIVGLFGLLPGRSAPLARGLALDQRMLKGLCPLLQLLQQPSSLGLQRLVPPQRSPRVLWSQLRCREPDMRSVHAQQSLQGGLRPLGLRRRRSWRSRCRPKVPTTPDSGRGPPVPQLIQPLAHPLHGCLPNLLGLHLVQRVAEALQGCLPVLRGRLHLTQLIAKLLHGHLSDLRGLHLVQPVAKALQSRRPCCPSGLRGLPRPAHPGAIGDPPACCRVPTAHCLAPLAREVAVRVDSWQLFPAQPAALRAAPGAPATPGIRSQQACLASDRLLLTYMLMQHLSRCLSMQHPNGVI